MKKTCTQCRQTKPLSEFYKDRSIKTDGHRGMCKECVTKRSKKRRRQFYQENREEQIATVRAWQKDNAEHYRLYRKAYYTNRRAAEIGASGEITLEELGDLEKAQEMLCAICSREMVVGDRQLRPNVDHIEAMALGGPNEISNVQILCEECHDSKTAGDRNKIRSQNNKAYAEKVMADYDAMQA